MTNNDIFISNQKRTKISPLETLEVIYPDNFDEDNPPKEDVICQIKVNGEVFAKVYYSNFYVVYNKIVGAIENWDTLIDLYKIAGPDPGVLKDEK